MKVRKMSAVRCEIDSGTRTRRISFSLERGLKSAPAGGLEVRSPKRSPSARVRSAPAQNAAEAGRMKPRRLANQTCVTAPRVRPTPKMSRRGRWKAEDARRMPPSVQVSSQRRKRSLSSMLSKLYLIQF